MNSIKYTLLHKSNKLIIDLFYLCQTVRFRIAIHTCNSFINLIPAKEPIQINYFLYKGDTILNAIHY